MTEWKARRFWKEARVEGEPGQWRIELDGRPLRSPNKTLIVMPSVRLAEAVRDEWQAQDDVIDPLSMPFTRTVNSALDKVAPQRDEVIDMLAAYGETDLVCYRAEAPAELIARQAAGWDPILDWAADTLSARLIPTSGIVPVEQPPSSLVSLRRQVAGFSDWQLTGFHDLVTLSGSLLLAFAVASGRESAGAAWTLSRIDETWQEELWGSDEEAAEAAANRYEAFLHASRVLELLADDA